MTTNNHNYTRVTGITTEVLISAAPVRLHGIVPEATTAGTITVRDAAGTGGSNVAHVAGIGFTQQGKNFGTDGARMNIGLTVQPSSAADSFMVVWSALP